MVCAEMSALFLTTDQVAKRWQMSPRAVREMAQAGEVPAAKFGRLWRFPIDQLEKFERAVVAA
jgi:excisionase family DNA binding protein